MRQLWACAAGHRRTVHLCGNTNLHELDPDEGLIRQAVLTDAEILTFDEDEVPRYTGAAALLRY